MYCKYCGKELREGVRFCTNCGKPVPVLLHSKKTKNKRSVIRVLIAMVILLVGVGTVGIGYKIYVQKNSSEEKTERLIDAMKAEEEKIAALAEEEARGKDGLGREAYAEEEDDSRNDPKTELTRVSGGHTDQKKGYVNAEGEAVIPTIFDKLSKPGDNGLICAEFMAGYADKEDGFKLNEVTRFYDENGLLAYDYVRGFGEKQSTAAREGQEYFLIDRQGNRISENSYTYIEEADSYGNFAAVQGTYLGLLDQEGKEIISPQDVRIMPIDRFYTDTDGVYLVMEAGASQIITDQGEIAVPWQNGQIMTVSLKQQRYQINLEDGITEIRDFDGKMIDSGTNASITMYPNGCFQKNESMTVFDPDGQVFLPGQNEKGYLQQVNSFSAEGIGAGMVYTRGMDEYRSKQGLSTLDGKINLPCEYDQIYFVPDKQMIIYSRDKKVGVMDLEGEQLWEQAYDYAFIFNTRNKKDTDNMLLVKRGEKYGLVEIHTGKVGMECVYDFISKDSYVDGSWLWSKDAAYGFWNQKGRSIKEIPVSGEYKIESFHMGSGSESINVYDYKLGEFLKIREGMSVGVMDREGRRVIAPCYTDVCYDPDNEIFCAFSDGGIALFDKDGYMLGKQAGFWEVRWDSSVICTKSENVKCFNYEDTECFMEESIEPRSLVEEGYIAAYGEGEVYSLWTTNGQYIQGLDYQWVSDRIVDGLILVQDWDDKYGYINSDGEEIIPCTFVDAKDFEHGAAEVMDLEEEWRLINVQGTMGTITATGNGTYTY